MKAALEKSPISENYAFEAKYLEAPHFDPNWHFHPEYQLFLVEKGTGTRFIGDHVSTFREGDLVFTGPNLPHLWQSDHAYFENNSSLNAAGIVIYFPENFLGKDFLYKNELYKVKQLLQDAQRGMEISGETYLQVSNMMRAILNLKDFDRILTLLNLLNVIANSTDHKLLATEGYFNSMKEAQRDRMSRVHTYVMKNFREKINLEDVAAIANMSPSSFSRYFKNHANKTFSDFLIEIRVGHSCKLLTNQKINISQVCYDSGFSTASNFNRQFKKITHYSPLEYRRKYSLHF
ncbi:MAG TPA: AraC family transcriptional regulator [Chryseolinea sp.]|nr:AraC family transcriptional regulator [Chryseolinea sp.]HPH46737.1 AraC family transcriptional regulator [Chryseolinea sp.]HPM31714.1 AraC family transcriptional regulator [Chryseolinea sp.]